MESSNDRLLIAINILIGAYEKECIKNISQENEQCLDIMQVSNLHKIQMLADTTEATQGVDFNLNTNEYVEERAPKEDAVQELHAPESECSTTSKYEKLYNKVESAAKKVESVKIKSTAYKKTIEGVDKSYNYITGGVNKIEDQLNCFDCRPKIGDLDLMPSYEFTWELKLFLNNLKSLLRDIQLSLNDENLLKDICSWLSLVKENALCLSSYPMLLATVPILINKAKFELLEIGFSWTGLIGGLIASLLGTITKLVEFLRSMIDSGLTCILNAFSLMRRTVDSIVNLARSLQEQARLVAASGEYVFEGIKNFNQKEVKASPERTVPSRGLAAQIFEKFAELKNDAASTKREIAKETTKRRNEKDDFVGPPAEAEYLSRPSEKIRQDLLTNKAVFPKTEGNLGFRFQHSSEFRNFQQASIYAKSSDAFMNDNQIAGMNSVSAIILKIENAVKEAIDSINNIAFKATYTLKAISRMIVEPIFVSAKLIGEIKAALNFGRLIKLVIRVANKGFDLCSDFESDENNSILASLIEEEFASTSIVFEEDPNTNRTVAIAKNKYSNYSRRIEPNDCGEIFVKVNEKQRDLDLVYDSIVKSLG